MRAGSWPRPGRAALFLLCAATLSRAAPRDQAGAWPETSPARTATEVLANTSGHRSAVAGEPLQSFLSGNPATGSDGSGRIDGNSLRRAHLLAGRMEEHGEVSTAPVKPFPRPTEPNAHRMTTAVTTAAVANGTASATVATTVETTGAAAAPSAANATLFYGGGGGASPRSGILPGNGTAAGWAPAGVSHFLDSPVLYILLPFVLFNKCAFGCKMDGEALRGLRSRPAPIALGLAAQFVVMPLLGYGLSRAFALDEELSLGLVVACSCPGGGGGYLYSLLLGGDVALALAMTLASTLVAVAAMPASTALYGRALGVHHTLRVPFSRILATLLFVLVPVSLGALVRRRRPLLAEALLDVIRPFTLAVALGGLYVGAHAAVSLLGGGGAPAGLYGAAALVPVCGLLVGATLARAARLPGPAARAVAIECGAQNSLLALAVLQLSLPQAQADRTSRAPFLVALGTALEMWLLLALNAAYSRLRPAKSDI
ncbi:P3 protein-like [Lethenteron reissneri]|uniref:P3 protein-like n=1 Tax=Lethenteron reissneri TaxID=7753 RepID=UPI002AB7D30E|nr:P3 protein-like [Lethenteron reissneri]XP_061429182.1 P3 protein-like [Lethenteron reissneri]XP_061429183.1 P3 protein-like [Lethenteron reissneri]XP_061429184.1 P3 protein-like [Lethenteron reissneri]